MNGRKKKKLLFTTLWQLMVMVMVLCLLAKCMHPLENRIYFNLYRFFRVLSSWFSIFLFLIQAFLVFLLLLLLLRFFFFIFILLWFFFGSTAIFFFLFCVLWSFEIPWFGDKITEQCNEWNETKKWKSKRTQRKQERNVNIIKLVNFRTIFTKQINYNLYCMKTTTTTISPTLSWSDKMKLVESIN